MHIDADTGPVIGQPGVGGGQGRIVVGAVEEIDQRAAIRLIEEMKLVDAQWTRSPKMDPILLGVVSSVGYATQPIGVLSLSGGGAFRGVSLPEMR